MILCFDVSLFIHSCCRACLFLCLFLFLSISLLLCTPVRSRVCVRAFQTCDIGVHRYGAELQPERVFAALPGHVAVQEVEGVLARLLRANFDARFAAHVSKGLARVENIHVSFLLLFGVHAFQVLASVKKM